MGSSLSKRSFLSLSDFTPDEIRYLIDLAHEVKRQRRSGARHQRFAGLTLAMIYEKPSTRTRCAFETAFAEEGGHPVFLSLDDIQLGTKETIEDTARVLGRMFDAVQFRGYKQQTVETLANCSGVPVYNGLTDDYHPTQILADLMTIEEHFGRLNGVKLCFCGDGRNNVARSLSVGCAKMGLDLTIAAPPQLAPTERIRASSAEEAKSHGGSFRVTEEVEFAVKNADVVYTDVWASMGEEGLLAERERLLLPYQVNQRLMESTGKSSTIFLHCLPAVRGREVTAEVIDGPQSLVWEQAENRKHTIKALMLATLS